MELRNLWSSQTNPQTGEKFEVFSTFLHNIHNGSADIDRLLDSEYGDEMARIAQLRFQFEEDPMGDECLEYYQKLGVCKEMYNAENYYQRWAIFTPIEMSREAAKGKKYPLVIWNHGGTNPIEIDEFSTYFTQNAGREKYVVVMAQNTNHDFILNVLDFVEHNYAVDPERVYITGYSQGGCTAMSFAMRHPERIAGCAPCGQDILFPRDNKDVSFTMSEAIRLAEYFVPQIQIVGAYEMKSWAPLNRYIPWNGKGIRDSLYLDPRIDDQMDPTRNNGKSAEPFVPGATVEDGGRWKLGLLNADLLILGCEPRDVKKCLSYREHPEDRLHYRLGFYGDREETRSYYGLEHYVADVYNMDGLHALRYVVADNSPHWPPLMLGELAWEFLRQFKRDRDSRKILEEPYDPS